jgi:anti-sigma B factor antagonist
VAFAVDAATSGGHVVLTVRGDVDLATAPLLRDRLSHALSDAVAGSPSVVVDLAAVGFMDSTGLGVLVSAHHRAAASGRRLVIARPQRIVRNALRLVQVDTVIDVYDTLDDAVAVV